MIWFIIAILLSVVLATYLSALNFALMSMSRGSLQRKLTEKGRPTAGDWLQDQVECAALATALLRTLVRMSIYMLVLAAMIGLRTRATVTWLDLVVSGVVSAIVIWFTTIVLGSAIARHAGTSLIVSSLTVLRVITLCCQPFARTGMGVNELIRRLIGTRDDEEAEAELLESIEDVHREGALDVQSAEILENVVEFTNTHVSDVMTPRPEIEGIEYTDDLAAIRRFIQQAGHSRIPVYRGTVDNIVGILYVKDLVKYLGQNVTDFKLEPFLRKPIVVPETNPVKKMLTDFQRGEVHLAIVVDEYGSTSGLITIEDVLEEIVGEIRDEHEPIHDVGPELRVIDEQQVEVDGRFRIDELNERLGLSVPEDGYDTIGGFVMAHFGRVPRQGEGFESSGVRFVTSAANATNVQKVMIELLQDSAESDAAMSSEQTTQGQEATPRELPLAARNV